MNPQLRRSVVGQAVAGGTAVLILLSAVQSTMSAQTAAPARSAREVLEDYRKMDARGERLTPDGWNRGAKFFVKPSRPPLHLVVEVVDGERVTDPDRAFKGGSRAKGAVMCSADGQIDAAARFTVVVAPGPAFRAGVEGQQIRGPAPMYREYDLVLTDTHWEFVPGREDLREVKGTPEWRIDGAPELVPWVTVEAAIGYLTRLRDGSSNPATKRNAERSIAELARFLK